MGLIIENVQLILYENDFKKYHKRIIEIDHMIFFDSFYLCFTFNCNI